MNNTAAPTTFEKLPFEAWDKPAFRSTLDPRFEIVERGWAWEIYKMASDGVTLDHIHLSHNLAEAERVIAREIR